MKIFDRIKKFLKIKNRYFLQYHVNRDWFKNNINTEKSLKEIYLLEEIVKEATKLDVVVYSYHIERKYNYARIYFYTYDNEIKNTFLRMFNSKFQNRIIIDLFNVAR